MDFFGFTFIMFTGAAIAAVGLLILILVAFTTSAAWGIASLVFPPVAIVFAITHFSKGRNGFAILMIGVIIFAYGSWDKRRLEGEQQVRETAQEEHQVIEPELPHPSDPVVESTSPEHPVAPPATATQPATDSPVAEPKYTVINIIDINKYVGQQVRVTTVNGAVRIGELLEVNKESIVINFRPKGIDTLVRADIKESEIELIELVPN